ncbi:MAG: hypothetical protein KJP09_04390, partial [Bacteroidia bacterium]|nr:hypothetical protein [Bacteroidia bacterium]NNK27548.1 hypothetical protein [Flavobacteriaceae bacterium]
YFEVNSDLNQFSYSDNELTAQQVYIQRGCFCASVNPVPVSVGSITGTKLPNGTWDIDISISLEWDEFSETDSRTISGIFSAQ